MRIFFATLSAGIVLLSCFQASVGRNATHRKPKMYIIDTPAGRREVEVTNEKISKDKKMPMYRDRERVLRAGRIVPNETPCNYKTYLDFYHDTLNSNTSTYEVLLSTTVTFPDGSIYYYYDPEELCIEVDDELIIDIYKYDCDQAEICVCGIYMGYVDLNVPQPQDELGERRYVAVNGLDRKLVEEDGICDSGLKGHCTMDNSTALEKLDCHSMYECVQDDTIGPILKNMKTGETYGICLPKEVKVPDEDNRINYKKP